MKLKKIVCLIVAISFIYLFSSSEVYAARKENYTGNIDEAKYPGYKQLLDSVISKYGFNIELYYTDLDWNQAVKLQYQGHGNNPKSLFYPDDSKKGMWYCPICGEEEYDSLIPCASIEAISYMIDPRNSLNEESIYQFMNIEGNNISEEQIAEIVKGTFLNDAEVISALYEAAETTKLNAAFLVAKIVLEQGSNGSELSSGKTGFYNFYNFGATGKGQENIIKNGLAFAKEQGWNTKRNAIIGGAQIIKSQYVDSRGQISFYFLKYNYAGREAFASWQYEQNIMGAESKGRILRKYYKQMNNLPAPTFVIPVFENMPTVKAARPDTSMQSSITFEEGVITNAPSGLKLRAEGSTSGVHIVTLSNGSNVKIIKRAENKVGKYYWDLIVSEDGSYGYAAREIGNDTCITGTGIWKTLFGKNDVSGLGNGKQVIATDDGIIHMTPPVLVEDIKKVYPSAKVYATNGNEMLGGDIGTYSKVVIDGKEYRVAKRGDVDGDGYATILDVILIYNHVKEFEILEDPIRIQASRIANGSKITVLDVTQLLNYVKNIGNIAL